MAKARTANSLTKQYAYLKRRISKAQGKAKFVGVLYLIGTLAIAALCCLQLLTVDGATLGAMAFWKPFLQLKAEGGILASIKANFTVLAIAVLYGVLLLTLLICVIKSLRSLGWLFKKKASKLYGFNRNAYAMDDMGRYFSTAFATAVSCHFLIVVLAGGVTQMNMLAYALLGVGLVVHFLCGIVGGTVSLFSTDGELYEEKREVGSFSPFVRNLLQIAVTAVALYFFVKANTLRGALDEILANGLGQGVKAFIIPALQAVIAVWLVMMTGYATGMKEYDADGADAPGRKAFLWLSLLLLLTVGGMVAYAKLMAKTSIENGMLIIAGVAFAAFVLELCLRKLPKNKYAPTDEVDTGVFMKENYTKPGVYIPDGENGNR
jgi:hypothetical protein